MVTSFAPHDRDHVAGVRNSGNRIEESRRLIQLKIVLLAAMPNARVAIATEVKPGFLIS